MRKKELSAEVGQEELLKFAMRLGRLIRIIKMARPDIAYQVAATPASRMGEIAMANIIKKTRPKYHSG